MRSAPRAHERVVIRESTDSTRSIRGLFRRWRAGVCIARSIECSRRRVQRCGGGGKESTARHRG